VCRLSRILSHTDTYNRKTKVCVSVWVSGCALSGVGGLIGSSENGVDGQRRSAEVVCGAFW
jgi:hypothetical protein